MRVCLICVEIFAWGKYGGFGRATRLIGRELAKRGVEVFAVVPRKGRAETCRAVGWHHRFKLSTLLSVRCEAVISGMQC